MITETNQNEGGITMNQWELKIKSGTLCKVRENTDNQVEIGFSFALIDQGGGESFLEQLRGKVKKTYARQSKIG